MKVEAIIPAAGLGKRLKSETLKPFVILNGKPIFIHTLEVLENCPLIEHIILVAQADYLEDFKTNIETFGLKKIKAVVPGGEERKDSVFNGLQELDADTDVVLIHDAARPLLSPETLVSSIQQCQTEKAVIVAVPVKPTIKEVNPDNLLVSGTLNRDLLWEVQTPQVFDRETLVRAHQQSFSHPVTDDAMLVEALGVGVKVVEGSYKNIKVTTQEDLPIAEAFLKEQKEV